MRDRSQSLLSEVLPPEERVIEAVVARYQRVAPAITRFARALADNEDLVVRLGSQASAGTEITIDPGVFQAAYARRAPVTPTEVALASALHEVIHLIASDFDERRPIPGHWRTEQEPDTAGPPPVGTHPAFDGLEEPTDEEVLEAGSLLLEDEFLDDDVLDEAVLDEAGDLADVYDVAPPGPEAPPAAAALPLLDAIREAAGPAAESMFLSIEDARQERRYLGVYPGARSVVADLYTAALPEAIAEARPLGQYALACFLLVGGYADRQSLQRRTEPHVAAALDDAAAFLNAVPETDDPWDVADLALQLLQVARLHGLVTDDPGSTTSQRKLQMAVDQSAISEGVDAVRMVTPSLIDAESYDQTRQAAQAVAAEAGRKGPSEQAGDPATDQLVKVSQAPTVYLPTGQGGKLLVTDFPTRFDAFAPEGRQRLSEAALQWSVAQRRVSGELYPLFLANQRRGLQSGFDAGDLSPYSALLLGAGLYERMFERRDLPRKRSYGVSLLVDGSASMLQPRGVGGGRKAPWALAAATLGAWTLAKLCDELQIEFEVALFNRSFVAAPDDTEQTFVERRARATGALRRSHGGAAERLTRTVNHYLVKSYSGRWRSAEDRLAGLFYLASSPQEAARQTRSSQETAPPISMFDKAANVDEFNVSHAAERLAARRVSTRIMVVLADGMTRGSVSSLAASVEAVERSGAVILGIGIGDGTVQAAYNRNQVVERPEELAAAMVDGVRSTLYRTIATLGGDTWWAHSSERALYDLPSGRRPLSA
jgi:hypothetical protein